MPDEIDYGTLFGIDEGAEAQEVADPASDAAGVQGAEVQDVAEPAEDQEGASNGNDAEENITDGNGNAAEENKQSAAERSRFAAARRKAEAERDAAIAEAKRDAAEAAKKAIDEAFRESGLTNPYTGKPITTKAEYDEYAVRRDAERKERLLKKSGMSDEEFGRFVDSLPEVQAAKLAQEKAEKEAAAAREKQAKISIDDQVRRIGELDPSIKELSDLSKMETYPQFYELVKKGNSLVDAYKLANFETLRTRAASASRQAAINSAQGKSHMTQTSSRGAGSVSVPEEIREEYKAFNPGASEAEIQEHYNRYVKK